MTAAKTDCAGILEELRRPGAVAVVSHVNPDGDAVGSMLAMMELLRALGHERVHPVMEDPVPAAYDWLSGAEEMLQPQDVHEPVDMVIVLDASRCARLGAVERLCKEPARIVVVDHHRDPTPWGHVAWADPAYGAVGEMVAELYEAAGIEMTLPVAKALYVAIATDTGSFRYPSTTGRTHRIAAHLIDQGLDVGGITECVFDKITQARFQLMVRILNRMELAAEGRVAFSFVTQQDLAETGAHDDELSNLINPGRSIETVHVAILFRVVDANQTRVSLRAKQAFDASKVAKHFGGGGHHGAAGATVDLPYEGAREKVLAYVRQCLGE